MEHRILGRTGVTVSKLCLGAMMFGAWGNTDHDDCIRIIHRALDAGSTSSTQRTWIRAASQSRSSARHSPRGGVNASCGRPRCTRRWGTTRTSSATRGRWITREVANSLRRLRTEWIEIQSQVDPLGSAIRLCRLDRGHPHLADAVAQRWPGADLLST